MLSIGTMNMRYKSDEIDKVQVLYRIKVADENLSGTGKFDINADDFDKGTNHIKQLSESHFTEKVEELKWKIEEVDIDDDEDEPSPGDDEPVVVIFSGKTKNRELKVTGNFEMSIDEYEGNKTLDALKDKAKEYTIDKGLED